MRPAINHIVLIKTYAKLAYRFILGSKLYELLEFRRHIGYWPNLNRPQTFNEKISSRKFQPLPEAVILADKLAVREIVASKVGPQYLTHLYYGGNYPEAVDYEALPRQFVLKGNHGSGPGACQLVWDREHLPRHAFVERGQRILRMKFGSEGNEWWYSKIRPKIMVEEMILDEDGHPPIDYKFYVFGGAVRYIQVIVGRHSNQKSSRFYDHEWRAQPFSRTMFDASTDVPRPRTLTEMIRVAEELGDQLDFVRVDLYSVGQRVLFGEITLAPGAGWVPFDPPEYDLVLGQHWHAAMETTTQVGRQPSVSSTHIG